jgi:hypothetical protein
MADDVADSQSSGVKLFTNALIATDARLKRLGK